MQRNVPDGHSADRQGSEGDVEVQGDYNQNANSMTTRITWAYTQDLAYSYRVSAEAGTVSYCENTTPKRALILKGLRCDSARLFLI